MASMLDHYKASMVLSGTGDALGFRNAGWEFCREGAVIHSDVEKRGGLQNILVALPHFRLSDDTIMHLATGEALVEYGNREDKEVLYSLIAAKYKESMDDMRARSVGATCRGAYALEPHRPKGYCVPFDSRGGGCGGAMRAMCIGLRYSRPDQIDDLIAVSCESGRMTHHHPTGYLGAMAAALFTSFSVQQRPVKKWGAALLELLPKALQYIESQGRHVEDNKNAWSYFQDAWARYVKDRGIADGKSEPKFPKVYGVKERDDYYTRLSYEGWGGASGHDAPMIAYDALLGSGDNWEELCKRGMLHGGDNDSTGVIAGACYGAMYGLDKVFPKNYQELEYRERLEMVGAELYKLNYPGEGGSQQGTESQQTTTSTETASGGCQ